jgi:hypothetical protein
VKVLLDENLPHALRLEIPLHEVFTAAYMGWAGVRNGELLRRAAVAKFDALVTGDRGFIHQQNTTELPLAVVVLVGGDTSLGKLIELVPKLLAALGSLKPNGLIVVG